MKKKFLILSLSLALCMVLCVAAQASENPFIDISDGDLWNDAVTWAFENGVTTGVSADTFAPESTCTRGQVVTFLWRAMGKPEPKGSANPFTDVKPGSYYEKAVLWAVEKGVTNGTSATTFTPDRTCNEGEILTFLWRSRGKPQPLGKSGLSVDYTGAFYEVPVGWADTYGILAGTGNGFHPLDGCSRAHTVLYLYRAAVPDAVVTNAKELLEAIASNKKVLLLPGEYNLSAYLNTLDVKPGENITRNPGVLCEEVYDGWEVQIRDVSDLILMGTDAEHTTIVVEPRYADVLSFFDCKNIVLENLTLGHTVEQGMCSGAVLSFEDCKDISLSLLDLYGCGTYGVMASKTEELFVRLSEIHDCSYGGISFDGVRSCGFYNSTVTACGDLSILDIWSSDVVFDNCWLIENIFTKYNSLVNCSEGSTVLFRDCVFGSSEYESLINDPNFNHSILDENSTKL